MDITGFFIFISGIIHLIRSIVSRNKVANYYFNFSKLVIIKEEKLLKLQLYFSIVLSLYAIVLGLILNIYNLRITYIFILLSLFLVGKHIFILILKKMGYIKYSSQ